MGQGLIGGGVCIDGVCTLKKSETLALASDAGATLPLSPLGSSFDSPLKLEPKMATKGSTKVPLKLEPKMATKGSMGACSGSTLRKKAKFSTNKYKIYWTRQRVLK